MRDGENSPKGTADNGMCLKGAARLRFVVVLAALPLLAQRRTVPEVAARRRLIG
jgi:hypothetical protein